MQACHCVSLSLRVHAIVWDYVVISAEWRACACGIKIIGLRQRFTPKPLDQEAPDCCTDLPEDILPWPFWLFLLSSAPGALAECSARAHTEAASCVQTVTVQCMCQIRDRQVAGSGAELFFPAQPSQTANPLLWVSSQPECMGSPHTWSAA